MMDTRPMHPERLAWARRRLSLLACLLALGGALAAQSASAASPILTEYRIQVGDLERHYWLHLPRRANPSGAMPLVVVLHGGGGADAGQMMRRYGFDEIADARGIAVVYPYGIEGQWNDGRGVAFGDTGDISQVDDVAFVDAMIEAIAAQWPIDRDRVYVTGASNGGMMTHRLGIELGDKLAAIAPMISNIPVPIADAQPVRPLPVLIVNGTEDPLVPWDGGPVTVFRQEYGEVLSTAASLEFWLAADGLGGAAPRGRWLPDTVRRDRCRVHRTSYGVEGSAAEVVLYAMVGGGHSVPGSSAPSPARLTWNKCMDIDGARVVMDFFAGHRRGG